MPERSLRCSWPSARGQLDVSSSLTMDRVLEHLSNLAREVSLDYERSMNKINFDQIVASKPDTFSYVTLPEEEEEEVPEQGEGC